MAMTRTSSWPDGILDAGRTVFRQKWDHIRDTLARRRVYRVTHQQLSMLTDRDLTDLGIPRSNIRKIAREAAYGQ